MKSNKSITSSNALEFQDYKAFFESLGKHVIASATDAEGRIIYVNDKFLEVSRYSREELLGQNHRILKSGFHEPAFYANLWKTITSGKVWRGEIKNRAKDGTFYWVDTSIAPIIGPDGKPEKYVSVRFVITERKEIEWELEQRKKESEFLAAATAILASSLDHDIVVRNIAELIVPRLADWCAIDLVEENSGDVILKRVAVKHHDASKSAMAERLQDIAPDGVGHGDLPLRILRTRRSEMVADANTLDIDSLIPNPEHRSLVKELGFKSLLRVPIEHRDKLKGVITMVRGDSLRRYSNDDKVLAEELVKRAGIAIENVRLYTQLQESDAKKDQFIATLAHELRNPLAPLLLRAELLQTYFENSKNKDPILVDTASVIDRQVRTMARLLDDLLDISRLLRGKINLRREYIDVITLVSRAVETTETHFRDHRVKLSLALSDERLTVYVDPVRMEQAVINLLTNAAKFNKAEGNVWVKTGREGDSVYLSVKDDGAGIDANMLPKIFDVFVQEKSYPPKSQGGLGIGLALAKKFVELHGGTLTALSEGVSKGAEFRIVLPAASTKQSTRGRPRILLVDDNVDAVTALAQYLKVAGYKDVYVTTSGQEAIDVGKNLRPNYVFMDIRMPGLSGYDTAKAMKKDPAFNESTFVAITGYGQDEDKLKAEEAGFEHHFVKPVDTKALLNVLQASG